jgi:hypothetical protein
MANANRLGLCLVLCLAPLAACSAAPREDAARVESASTGVSCDQPRRQGEAHVRATVRVDQYVGLKHGFNGTHEIFHGTITDMPYASHPDLIDSNNVQVAMNVASRRDDLGLPGEIKLDVGSEVTLEGDYVPAATANAFTANGPAAVIHYTHAPCGSVTIDGQTY